MLRKQQRQAAKVCMTARGDSLSFIPLFLSASVVDHVSQVVVRTLIVSMSVDQVVFRQFQNNSQQNKQFSDNIVEKITMESRDLIVVLSHDPVSRKIIPYRDCFGDIELFKLASLVHYRINFLKHTISTLSFTPVSPIHLSFSRYPKYSPSAKLHAKLRFSSSGSLKKAFPMLN